MDDGPPVDREEEGFEMHQVGSQVEQPRTLRERFEDEPEPKVLEVPESAMNQARGSARCTRCDVVLLNQRRAHPAAGRIEEGSRADDPPTDDDDIERVRPEGGEIGATAFERWRHVVRRTSRVERVIGLIPADA
jgi:hypothetical protein